MRALLSNYRRREEGPADINQLDGAPTANSRALFDEYLGVNSSDLPPLAITRYRPDYYRLLARDSEESTLVKVHDAYSDNGYGQALFPAEISYGAVYLVRNPLDVAISYAHHNGSDIDTAIACMADDRHSLFDVPQRLDLQLPQRLLSWSHHVQGWLNQPEIDILPIRYEDLLLDPSTQLRRVIRFAGWSVDSSQIELAVRHSRFQCLREQELQKNFSEKPPGTGRFFRDGRAGQWREILTVIQRERIIAEHGEVMDRFGYLAPFHG